MGEELHQVTLENQHKMFRLVHRNVKRAKKRQFQYANKNAKEVDLQVGDPVFYKINQRKSKLQAKWKAYYRIVEKKTPTTFIIRDQLTGTTTKAHAEHLRKASMEWEIPIDENGRTMRRPAYAVPPESESDDES